MGDGTFGSERLWSYANMDDTTSARGLFFPDDWSDLHQEKLSGARRHLRLLVRHQIHKQTYTHSRLSKKISKRVDGNIFGRSINIPDAHA